MIARWRCAIVLLALLSTQAAARPNVILYVIDTLRADHTGLYGYDRATTPRIDAFAAEGATCLDAQAAAPWTKPSMASVFTSTYPPTHGATSHEAAVADEMGTLATALHDAGYNTAGITDNPFTGENSNLARGYNTFLERGDVQKRLPATASSAAVHALAVEWLESATATPFFLYLHTMDPHLPYRPPPPFNRRWADPAQDAECDSWLDLLSAIRRSGGGMLATPADCAKYKIDADELRDRFIDRYDGEIAHNDARFGDLVDELNKRGLSKNTLVIVMSDHGEAFFDHGWSSHGTNVYFEEIHAVLAMRLPGIVAPGLRIDPTVSLIDIAPTVLDFCAVPAPAGFQGRSLLPLVRNEDAPAVPAFSVQTFAPDPPSDCPPRADSSYAMITTEWKAILNLAPDGAESVELYNRIANPKELHNVAAENATVAEPMAESIRRWLHDQNSTAGDEAEEREIDPALREQMKALGYVR